MMNIQNETAILGKKKGYNPPYYQVKRWLEPSVNGDVVMTKAFSAIEYDSKVHTAIVTQTLLQQWLSARDLDVLVDIGNNGKKFYKCRVWYQGGSCLAYVTSFETYEEALEAGFVAALEELTDI